MYIKYHLIYYIGSILLVLIAQLYHPVFYFILAGYYIWISKRLNVKSLIFMLILTFLFLQTMQYPATCNDTIVTGRLTKVEDNQVVLKTNRAKIKVYGDFSNFQEGDEVTVKLQYFAIQEPTNDHAFNYQRYLYSMGIMQQATCEEIISHTKHSTIYNWLKKRINHDETIDSFASLFLLGVKDEQMQQYYQQMTALSIVHLFALSGMHLHILKKWLKGIGKYFISPFFLDYVIIAVIGFYVSILPFNISFIRAYIVMVCLKLGRGHLHAIDALAIAMAILMFINPYVIYNISFIFSCFMYFIVIMVKNHKHVSICIYLASLPIIMTLQYRISVSSFILGILFMPVVSWLYQLLLCYVFLGSLIAPVIHVFILLFSYMLTFSSTFTIYISFTQPTLFFILVYYFYYFRYLWKASICYRYKQEAIKLVCILVMFYFYPYYAMIGKVVMIDVGQGDCFLIKQAFHNGNILIDTGGLKDRDIASDTIVPYLRSEGIDSLDYVIISHNDFDHCGGYESLATQIPVKHKIESYIERIELGDVIIEMLSVDNVGSSINDQSLVCKIEYNGLRYLFMGDCSSEVELALYAKYGSMDIDVLKVGHHGSATSTSSTFLTMIHPKVALISCGKNNMYGHPNEEVIERLQSYGVHIYRSDKTGMVSIVNYGGKNYIYQ